MTNSYVLITGAAKRLAKKIAIFLAKQNYNIIIQYNNSKKEAGELVNYLKTEYNVDCFSVQADFNNDNDIKNIFKYLKQHNIKINVLINSASSFHFDDFYNYESSKWNENFNTNLKAPYLLSVEFVKYLEEIHNISFALNNKEDKNELYRNIECELGNIINIVDSWSCKVDTRFLSYNLAKIVLWRLTESMALELAPLVRVNAVAPGLTVKPDNMEEERFSKMYIQTPIPKAVNPHDIAQTIWFILNNKSLCGEIIKVDCGKSLNSKN